MEMALESELAGSVVADMSKLLATSTAPGHELSE